MIIGKMKSIGLEVNMEKKIKFGDLNGWLKAAIVGGWAYLIIGGAVFIVTFVVEIAKTI